MYQDLLSLLRFERADSSENDAVKEDEQTTDNIPTTSQSSHPVSTTSPIPISSDDEAMDLGSRCGSSTSCSSVETTASAAASKCPDTPPNTPLSTRGTCHRSSSSSSSSQGINGGKSNGYTTSSS